jgi:hypothetical protein
MKQLATPAAGATDGPAVLLVRQFSLLDRLLLT